MQPEIRFAVIPLKNRSNLCEQEYSSAYQTFKLVWNDAFKEIFGASYQLYSNDFTRQDYAQAIFYQDQCIALDLIREINFTNSADRDDSWLKPWSKSDLDQLSWRSGTNKGLINSYFTVHPDFRRTIGQSDLNAGYLMGCLSVLHQLETNHQVMLGMMRNNRSMNKLGKLWGSSTILENITYNFTPTDLVAFFENDIIEAKKNFPKIIFDIFDHKTDYTQRGTNERAA